MKPVRTLSLRLNAESAAALRRLQRHTQQRTASKAIREAIARYPDMELKLDRALHDAGRYRRALARAHLKLDRFREDIAELEADLRPEASG